MGSRGGAPGGGLGGRSPPENFEFLKLMRAEEAKEKWFRIGFRGQIDFIKFV